MVKKLFKHEILSYMRLLLPAEGIMLCIAMLLRLVQFFETEDVWYSIVFVSLIVAVSIAMITCLVITVVMIIKRFYTNMFTHEGYLTLTLPVTPFQHITVKALIGGLALVEALAACLVGGIITTSGEVLTELIRAFDYYVAEIVAFLEQVGYAWNIVPWIIEIVLGLCLSLLSGILYFYLCISVGQLSHKNRILASFGFYFIVYFACQILATVFTIILAVTDFEIFELFFDFYEDHPFISLHIMLGGSDVISAALGALYFFISHKIISTKLNIE